MGPKGIYFVVILAASQLGVALLAARLFVCLPLMFVMAQNMLGVINMAVNGLSDLKVVLRRSCVSGHCCYGNK
ncbi:hypothetical protein DPMN_143975 [Dreissena polymorpha]|uniref:Uncharacterized protein n=1 Tax=Dreissena polymorpha TaxID=45954 RepID=A0A9D4JPT1_DREPO|nr:hypothetical protein DPMN_143975 [Dreissena polymorpha]